ncbi:hypothetical protein, partial [Fischerella thermalis]|uniref:hypothetical protein n=1 Tax=Fischerella thermalis TaxID=372787 RepID=UPI001CA54CA2
QYLHNSSRIYATPNFLLLILCSGTGRLCASTVIMPAICKPSLNFKQVDIIKPKMLMLIN